MENNRNTSNPVWLGMLGLQVTDSCDKACKMCCMSAKGVKAAAHMPFVRLERLVRRLAELGVRGCEVGITGGEPFLYCDDGHWLSDVISLVTTLKPREIYVQTSGDGPGVMDFDGQVQQIMATSGNSAIKFATSYTLYQREGIDVRMAKTLETLSAAIAPRHLEVHMTSDPQNREATLKGFEDLIEKMGFNVISLTGRGCLGVRANQTIVGRVAATVASGRARTWNALDMESEWDDAVVGCRWLADERRAMHVLPSGDVYVCCTSGAYRNTTHVVNVFHEDPALFFERYSKLRQRLTNIIITNDERPEINGRCARCNQIDHRTLLLRHEELRVI